MRRFFLVAVPFYATAGAPLTEETETGRPGPTGTPFLVPERYVRAEPGVNGEAYATDANRLLQPAGSDAFFREGKITSRKSIRPPRRRRRRSAPKSA